MGLLLTDNTQSLSLDGMYDIRRGISPFIGNVLTCNFAITSMSPMTSLLPMVNAKLVYNNSYPNHTCQGMLVKTQDTLM